MQYLSQQRILPVSVVIATLGGPTLRNTVVRLNEGDGVPAEILICVPEAEEVDAESLAVTANVEVIRTPCRGQVAQRSLGLSIARFPYVMQMDDDIILHPETLDSLYQALLSIGLGNVVTPFFRYASTGCDATRYPGPLRGFLRDLHATLVCGATFGRGRFGTISLSGLGFGVIMSSGPERIVESEWIPGGVALCHRTDLVHGNYYPFSGRAYSEDLIHSILWRDQGCRLLTLLDSPAFIDASVESFSLSSVMRRYRAHVYVAKLSGGSAWRTRLWLLFYVLINLRKILAHR